MSYTAVLFAGENLKTEQVNEVTEQSAVFSDTLSLYRRLSHTLPDHRLSGLGLGEITAICASGAMDEETAKTVVAKRAEFIAQSNQGQTHVCGTITGMDEQTVRAAIGQSPDGIVSIAYHLAKDRFILAGDEDACCHAVKILKDNGAGGDRLAYRGAPHSPKLNEVCWPFTQSIMELTFGQPNISLYSNISGMMYKNFTYLTDYFSVQMRMPVKLHQMLEQMTADGADRFIVIGQDGILVECVQAAGLPWKHIYDEATLKQFLEA